MHLRPFRVQRTGALLAVLVMTWPVVRGQVPPVPVPAAEPAVLGHAAPWGRIEVRPVYLEVPDALLASRPKPNSVPRWCFPNGTEASVRELFTRAGLPAAMQDRILNPAKRLIQQDTLILFPSPADQSAMTTGMRNIIYPELAKSLQNEFHYTPIYIQGGNLDEWLEHSGLNPALQLMVRQRVWQRDGNLVFSDVRALVEAAHSVDDVWSIFRAITRTRTLLIDLVLTPDLNTESVVDYWTAGDPAADTVPLLRAAIAGGGVSRLDVSRLLPPIPRRRLYTYPTLDLAAQGRMPDCHWSSLNFFSSSPQNYYLDSELVGARISDDYDFVKPPYRYGDLICYYRTPTITVHSCIYIADDIVYTKNGENTLAPWVFMPLEDVSAMYLLHPGWFIQGYRLKPGTRR